MLPITVRLCVTALFVAERIEARLAHVRDEEGQTSAEYALVLLGAAAVALLIVAWATKTQLVGKLLDAVMGALTDKVK